MAKPDVGHEKKMNMEMTADVGPLSIFCGFIESV